MSYQRNTNRAAGFAAAFLGLCVFIAPSISRAAGITTTTTTTDDQGLTETRLVAGLRWNFGTSTPEAVVGFRQTRTQRSDALDGTTGGQVDLTVPLSEDAWHPTLRALGLIGDREVQGQLGGGIRLFDWTLVGSVGLQAPYSEAGLNYLGGDDFQPYVGIDSVGILHKPGRTTTTTTTQRPPI